MSDLASCPAFLLSGLVPIRLESSLRLYPTVNPQVAFNQSTHVEVKRTAGRPRLKQPRLPSTTSRPLIAGMLVDSPGIVELEMWAMKSMSHRCAQEPYTSEIQCSGLRILDGHQFFALHYEEYAILLRPFLAVSWIQVLSSSAAFDMARMASNEGRSGTEVGLWVLLSTMSTGTLRPCPLAQSLHSTRLTPESRYDICTPAMHAQIAHELCRDPIRSPPLSGKASKRHDQWQSGKIPVAEGTCRLDLHRPALHFAGPTEHQTHAHPSGPRQWSLPGITLVPTCGPGPIRPFTNEHSAKSEQLSHPVAGRRSNQSSLTLSPIPTAHRRFCHHRAGIVDEKILSMAYGLRSESDARL
ncbi:hypothetical protein BKA70DRAFT_1424628 [Coprinopsis sp. MPI-PUGE-AT-0042]|nr:hypothetical protein BKA70DRAFT_1424628 [Coprinopsis sp. MPI-PUGE-AT-0042]